ncbi:MAG TPA: GntR family transcriptional regulator [Alphaproteobacteria bacterium]|nr:GntR family transcriptional regulator [Alphaproteobacteria bacterium]
MARAPDKETTGELVRALEEDILFGRLRPRERLVEDDLIDRFDATRHAVRQALAELERTGMVVRVANRGAQVRDFTREEVEQICAVREMLHAHAAALIPLPAAPALVARLEELDRAHRAAVERQNLSDIHRLNNEFHETLFAACGNPYLVATINEYARLSLAFRCHLMANQPLARRAAEQHHEMIEALKRGDRERIVRLCVEHTQPSKQVYMAIQGWIPAAPAAAAAERPSAKRRSA